MSGFRNQLLTRLLVANSVISSTGMFFYSSAPALGNLIASLGVAAAGTDAKGNAYLAGDTQYNHPSGPAGQVNATNVFGAAVNYAFATVPAGPFTTKSQVTPLDVTTGKLALVASLIAAQGDVDITTVGTGLRVAEGVNAKQGTAILVGGTKTVANTSVTANSRIDHWRQVAGGTLGHLSVGTIVAGTSFVINSSSNLDTSTIGYQIFEPG